MDLYFYIKAPKTTICHCYKSLTNRKMQHFNLLFRLITIAVFYLKHVNAGIGFQENIHAIQESSTKCVAKVVADFFDTGSIISVATSGLQYTATTKISTPTYNLIMTDIMEHNGHSVMIKEANSYNANMEVFSIQFLVFGKRF